MLVEWYLYLNQQLAFQLGTSQKSALRGSPTSHKRPLMLHAVDSLGFMENDAANCFGLASTLPPGSPTAIELATLYHLLARQVPNST